MRRINPYVPENDDIDADFDAELADAIEAFGDDVAGNYETDEESQDVLTAAGRWDPSLHPRDHHGRFISVGDLVHFFMGTEERTGTVTGIEDGRVAVDTVDRGTVRLRPDQIRESVGVRALLKGDTVGTKSAVAPLDPTTPQTRWYHGTDAELVPGDQLTPGHKPNFDYGEIDSNSMVWLTRNPVEARLYGKNVYEVTPQADRLMNWAEENGWGDDAEYDEWVTTKATVLGPVDEIGTKSNLSVSDFEFRMGDDGLAHLTPHGHATALDGHQTTKPAPTDGSVPPCPRCLDIASHQIADYEAGIEPEQPEALKQLARLADQVGAKSGIDLEDVEPGAEIVGELLPSIKGKPEYEAPATYSEEERVVLSGWRGDKVVISAVDEDELPLEVPIEAQRAYASVQDEVDALAGNQTYKGRPEKRSITLRGIDLLPTSSDSPAPNGAVGMYFGTRGEKAKEIEMALYEEDTHWVREQSELAHTFVHESAHAHFAEDDDANIDQYRPLLDALTLDMSGTAWEYGTTAGIQEFAPDLIAYSVVYPDIVAVQGMLHPEWDPAEIDRLVGGDLDQPDFHKVRDAAADMTGDEVGTKAALRLPAGVDVNQREGEPWPGVVKRAMKDEVGTEAHISTDGGTVEAMTKKAWTREAPGYYTRDGWHISKVESAYGDTQWVVDSPTKSPFAATDTFAGAKATVDRALADEVGGQSGIDIPEAEAEADPNVTTHNIKAIHLGELQARVDKLNKRAAKLNVEPMTLEIGTPEKREIYEKIVSADGVVTGSYPTGRYETWVDVTLTGTTPQLPGGWAFLGAIEHHHAGGDLNLVHGDDPRLAKYRTAEPECEHCHLARRRAHTVILEGPDGNLAQVGRACVKDYLGYHTRPDAWLAWADEVRDIADFDDERGFSSAPTFETNDALATVAAAVRVNGFTPKSAGEDNVPTAAIVAELLNPTRRRKELTSAQELADRVTVTPADTDKAAEIREWAAKIPADTDNNYLGNLHVILSKTFLDQKDLGIVSSSVSAADRDKERGAKFRWTKIDGEFVVKGPDADVGDIITINKADGSTVEAKVTAVVDPGVYKVEKIDALPKAGHWGEVGQRAEFIGRVTNVKAFDGDYGISYLVKLQTPEGHVLTTFSSGSFGQDAEIGKVVRAKGTVKEHGEYNGEPETKLARVTAIDWEADFATPEPKAKKTRAKKAKATAPLKDFYEANPELQAVIVDNLDIPEVGALHREIQHNADGSMGLPFGSTESLKQGEYDRVLLDVATAALFKNDRIAAATILRDLTINPNEQADHQRRTGQRYRGPKAGDEVGGTSAIRFSYQPATDEEGDLVDDEYTVTVKGQPVGVIKRDTSVPDRTFGAWRHGGKDFETRAQAADYVHQKWLASQDTGDEVGGTSAISAVPRELKLSDKAIESLNLELDGSINDIVSALEDKLADVYITSFPAERRAAAEDIAARIALPPKHDETELGKQQRAEILARAAERARLRDEVGGTSAIALDVPVRADLTFLHAHQSDADGHPVLGKVTAVNYGLVEYDTPTGPRAEWESDFGDTVGVVLDEPGNQSGIAVNAPRSELVAWSAEHPTEGAILDHLDEAYLASVLDTWGKWNPMANALPSASYDPATGDAGLNEIAQDLFDQDIITYTEALGIRDRLQVAPLLEFEDYSGAPPHAQSSNAAMVWLSWSGSKGIRRAAIDMTGKFTPDADPQINSNRDVIAEETARDYGYPEGFDSHDPKVIADGRRSYNTYAKVMLDTLARGGEPDAALQRSIATGDLYRGQAMTPEQIVKLRPGKKIDLPIVALTDREDKAQQFAYDRLKKETLYTVDSYRTSQYDDDYFDPEEAKFWDVVERENQLNAPVILKVVGDTPYITSSGITNGNDWHWTKTVPDPEGREYEDFETGVVRRTPKVVPAGMEVVSGGRFEVISNDGETITLRHLGVYDSNGNLIPDDAEDEVGSKAAISLDKDAGKYPTEVAHDIKLYELMEEQYKAWDEVDRQRGYLLSAATAARVQGGGRVEIRPLNGGPRTFSTLDDLPEGTLFYQAKTQRGDDPDEGYWVKDESATWNHRRRATDADALKVLPEDDKRVVTLNEALAKSQAAREAINAHEATYNGWNRYFLVPDGHVHRWTNCSTCYPTTRFAPLPVLSGHNDGEAVDMLGETLCTVCFPDAPVDARGKAKKITRAQVKKILDANKPPEVVPEKIEILAPKKPRQRKENVVTLTPGEWDFLKKLRTEGPFIETWWVPSAEDGGKGTKERPPVSPYGMERNNLITVKDYEAVDPDWVYDPTYEYGFEGVDPGEQYLRDKGVDKISGKIYEAVPWDANDPRQVGPGGDEAGAKSGINTRVRVPIMEQYPEYRQPLHTAFSEPGTPGNDTHITRSDKGMIPISVVANMPGAEGEMPGAHRNRKGEQWEEFKANIAENGLQNPLFIMVDSKGTRLSEGNHRRDAAVELGLPEVPVEIRYFGHTEREHEVYPPDPDVVGAKSGIDVVPDTTSIKSSRVGNIDTDRLTRRRAYLLRPETAREVDSREELRARTVELARIEQELVRRGEMPESETAMAKAQQWVDQVGGKSGIRTAADFPDAVPASALSSADFVKRDAISVPWEEVRQQDIADAHASGLYDEIAADGVRVPVQIFVPKDGPPEVSTGHHRIAVADDLDIDVPVYWYGPGYYEATGQRFSMDPKVFVSLRDAVGAKSGIALGDTLTPGGGHVPESVNGFTAEDVRQGAIAWMSGDLGTQISMDVAILGQQVADTPGGHNAMALLNYLAEAQTPIDQHLYRGFIGGKDPAGDFHVGQTMNLQPSSFSRSQAVASVFSEPDVKDRISDYKGVVFALDPGASGFPLGSNYGDSDAIPQVWQGEDEVLVSGAFEVVDIRPGYDGRTVVQIRQTEPFALDMLQQQNWEGIDWEQVRKDYAPREPEPEQPLLLLPPIPDAVAAAAVWSPDLHPRDQNGRFIDVGDLVRFFVGGSEDSGSIKSVKGDRVTVTTRRGDVVIRPRQIAESVNVRATLHPDEVGAKSGLGRNDPALDPIYRTPEAMPEPTPEEKAALQWYGSSGGARKMNSALRLGEASPYWTEVDGEVANGVEQITNYLNRASFPGGSVSRGVPIDLYSDVKPGDVLTEPGFTSTSIGLGTDTSQFGRTSLNIDIPAGAHAVLMWGYSPETGEVLIQRGANLRVDNVEPNYLGGRSLSTTLISEDEVGSKAAIITPTSLGADTDYRGQHQPNDEGPPAWDLSQDDFMPADVYDHPDWYVGDPGSQASRETIAVLRRVRGNPDATVTIYRGAPPGAEEINPGDWVTLSPTYAKEHGYDAVDPNKDWPVISREVPVNEVRFAGDDLNEFGWWPDEVGAESGISTAPSFVQVVDGGVPPGPLTRDGYDQLAAALSEGATVPDSGGGSLAPDERRTRYHKVIDHPGGALGGEGHFVLYDEGREGRGWPAEIPDTQRPLTHVWRAVTEEDWARIQAEGAISSDRRDAISDEEGMNAALEPESAMSYLPYPRNGGRGVIMRIKVAPESKWFAIGADDYARTREDIPIDLIDMVTPVIAREGKYNTLTMTGEEVSPDAAL